MKISICCRTISGNGFYGPYKDRAAFDGAVQAEGGIISVTGEEGGKAVRCGTAIADATAGLIGCIGTLGALYDAKRTGQGRRVDVSMMDSMVTIMENLISSSIITGQAPLPMGNRMYTASPFNSFTCRDGKEVYIGISTDAQFQKFCEIIHRESWTEDERFMIQAQRAQHHDILEAMTAEALREIDSETLCDEMQKHHLVYGRINDVTQVASHPQVEARHMIVDAVYADGTSFRVPGCPVKMSDMPEEESFNVAQLGENTLQIFSQYVAETQLHEIYDDVLEKCREAVAGKTHQIVSDHT